MIEADRRRLQDMLRFAEDAVAFLDLRDGRALEADEKSLVAVIGALILLGEAAAHISDSLRTSLPDVPWRQARDLRNLLVHRYFEIDAERLSETVRDHLPPLIASIAAIPGTEAPQP